MDLKLKQAREEIEAVLKKYDIGYHVVLHNWQPEEKLQGQTELFYNFRPSYTAAVIQPIMKDGEEVGFRLKSKKEDYPTAQAQADALAPAANLLDGMGSLLGQHAMALIHLMEDVNKKAGITHGEFVSTEPKKRKGH